jgi:hypothetical protein
MATLYRVDGTHETVHPRDGNTFTLLELQAYVDGYIECVATPQGYAEGQVVYANEEGLLKAMTPNPHAPRRFGRTLVGPVISCSPDEVA